MTATVLLTLGRLPKALDIARGFATAGWRVLVAEPFGWHLTGLSRAVAKSYRVTAPNTDPERYRHDMLEIIGKEQPRLVVPVSEETIHVAGFADQLPEGTSLFTMPQSELIPLHDKLAFAHMARYLGLAAPESAPFDCKTAHELAQSGPYVVKPRNNASGTDVSFHDRSDPLPDAENPSGMLIQRWISGETISSFSIAHKGHAVVTVFYRGVVMDGTVAVSFERIEGPSSAQRWVETFLEKSRHTGFIAFDFVIGTNGEAVAVECNPRATSGIHFLSQETLAPAILNDVPEDRNLLRRDVRLQQFFPALTVTQGSLFRRNGFIHNLNALRTACDVTWQARDPLPFILMTPASYRILLLAIFGRMSMGEAAIRDIGWFGPRSQNEPGLIVEQTRHTLNEVRENKPWEN